MLAYLSNLILNIQYSLSSRGLIFQLHTYITLINPKKIPILNAKKITVFLQVSVSSYREGMCK